VAEQNNELLMKNHEARPTGSSPFQEVNVATHDHYGKTHDLGHGRGQGRGCGLNRNHAGDYKNTFLTRS